MSSPSAGLADIAATIHPPEASGRFNMKCVDTSADETYFLSVQAEAIHRYVDGDALAPHPIGTSAEGMLHICSRSAAIFEPSAIHLPMIRIPLRESTACGEAPETAKARAKAEKRKRGARKTVARKLGTPKGMTMGVDSEEEGLQSLPLVLLVSANAHFEMKVVNRSAAYPLKRGASTLRILLHGPHTRTLAALQLQLQLWDVFKTSEEDYSGGQEALASLILQQEQRMFSALSFDPRTERTLFSGAATRVTPYCAARGRLVLTSTALYLQAVINAPGEQVTHVTHQRGVE
jgi:hypothetical protein